MGFDRYRLSTPIKLHALGQTSVARVLIYADFCTQCN